MATRRLSRRSMPSAPGNEGCTAGEGSEWIEWVRNGYGTVWSLVRNGMAIVPTLRVVATLGETSLRARDGRIVGSCRDITGPYPYILGKMYGVYWTGLGERAIESLRRIHLCV